MSDIAYAIAPPEQDGNGRQILADLSRSIVMLHKELYGKGPTKARSHMGGDVLVCVLGDGFTRAELTLLAGGRADLVHRQREELQGLARDRFTSTVESITGRTVVGYMSAMDDRARLSCEIFVFEPEEHAGLNGGFPRGGRAEPAHNGDRPG